MTVFQKLLQRMPIGRNSRTTAQTAAAQPISELKAAAQGYPSAIPPSPTSVPLPKAMGGGPLLDGKPREKDAEKKKNITKNILLPGGLDAKNVVLLRSQEAASSCGCAAMTPTLSYCPVGSLLAGDQLLAMDMSSGSLKWAKVATVRSDMQEEVPTSGQARRLGYMLVSVNGGGGGGGDEKEETKITLRVTAQQPMLVIIGSKERLEVRKACELRPGADRLFGFGVEKLLSQGKEAKEPMLVVGLHGEVTKSAAFGGGRSGSRVFVELEDSALGPQALLVCPSFEDSTCLLLPSGAMPSGKLDNAKTWKPPAGVSLVVRNSFLQVKEPSGSAQQEADPRRLKRSWSDSDLDIMAAQMEQHAMELYQRGVAPYGDELGSEIASSNGRTASSRGGNELKGLIASHCTFLGRLPGEKAAGRPTFCLRAMPLAQDFLGGAPPTTRKDTDQGSQDGSRYGSETSGFLSSGMASTASSGAVVRVGTDWVKDLRKGEWRQELGKDVVSLRTYEGLSLDEDGSRISFGSVAHHVLGTRGKKKCRVCAFSTTHRPGGHKLDGNRCKFGALCDFCHAGHKRFIHRQR